jgi:Xaa-Pro aminopeptidase
MAVAMDQTTRERITTERLAALRAAMSRHQLDAYLIPSVDEHINEYLPDNKQRRAWISGFTGSAGDCLVAQNEAWVFVDSRYHEQADYEVACAHMHISKLGLEGQPGVSEKIKALAEQAPSFRLGFDPFTLTVQQAQAFQAAFDGLGIALVPVSGNLIDPIWTDAPATPNAPVSALPERITGKSTADKLTAVRQKIKALKVDILPLTKLDQIAWLFNLRGQDVSYNPVFIAYAIVTADQALLFTEASRIPPDAMAALAGLVTIQPYADYAPTLQQLAPGKTTLVDAKHTTEGTRSIIAQNQGRVREAEHPVELLKAVKNDVEIRGMQEANLKASRGKIRAWYWLETQIAAGKTVTEASFRDAIEAFYAEEEGFAGLSFNTISGAGSNASIVHYGTPSAEKTLEKGELFLIDSGCQFRGQAFMGTTDDTRTLLVSDTATTLQKLRFTEVLKAHINCAMQKFPKGTEGMRLDGITRSTLWQNGLDYGHGTGHGVGAFLNVHEGPNGIHKLASKALEPGMINSIEPGYYEPGWGGIRLENLYRVVTQNTDEHRPGDSQPSNSLWLGFESLTYIPFEPKLTDLSRLSPEQRIWLEIYNRAIVEKIAPTLPPPEAEWLSRICRLEP